MKKNYLFACMMLCGAVMQGMHLKILTTSELKGKRANLQRLSSQHTCTVLCSAIPCSVGLYCAYAGCQSCNQLTLACGVLAVLGSSCCNYYAIQQQGVVASHILHVNAELKKRKQALIDGPKKQKMK